MGKKASLNIFRCKIQYVLMVFMHLCLAKSQAQVHTFVHTYQDWGSLDITEDKKNGYLFANGLNSVRIDRYGNKLWTQQLACDMLRQTDADTNCFFQFGSATEMGGFYYNKIDYQGNVLEENYIATLVKNDSQITPRDVIYDVKRDQFIVCGKKTDIWPEIVSFGLQDSTSTAKFCGKIHGQIQCKKARILSEFCQTKPLGAICCWVIPLMTMIIQKFSLLIAWEGLNPDISWTVVIMQLV